MNKFLFEFVKMKLNERSVRKTKHFTYTIIWLKSIFRCTVHPTFAEGDSESFECFEINSNCVRKTQESCRASVIITVIYLIVPTTLRRFWCKETWKSCLVYNMTMVFNIGKNSVCLCRDIAHISYSSFLQMPAVN